MFKWPWKWFKRRTDVAGFISQSNILIAKLIAERDAALAAKDAAEKRSRQLADQVRRMSERGR